MLILGITQNELDSQNELDLAPQISPLLFLPLTLAPNGNVSYGSGANSQLQVEIKENGMAPQKKTKTAQVNCAHEQKNWHKICSSDKFRDLTV